MSEQVSGRGQESGGAVALDGLPAWQLARRDRIVGSAMAALEEQEYESIQIRDVAAGAKVALGTLYRYFSSKEHLYAAVLRDWAAFERPRRTRASRLTPEARVRRRVHGVIRALVKQPQFFQVHVLLQASGDANARELLVEFNQSAQASLAGEFDMLPSDEAVDIAVMLWSIINTMMTRVVYHGEQISRLYEVADRFLDLLAPRLTDTTG